MMGPWARALLIGGLMLTDVPHYPHASFMWWVCLGGGAIWTFNGAVELTQSIRSRRRAAPAEGGPK